MRAGLAARMVLVAASGGALSSCDRDPLVSPRLEATCSASPATAAPLVPVAFVLNVSGAEGPFAVVVTYGDGTTATDPGRTHAFDAPGLYSVAFGVTTASQSARCSTVVSVVVPPVVIPIGDTPPQADFETTPAAGPGDRITGLAPLTVRFNMCGSSDVDQDVLRWTMDFQGDGSNEVDGTTGGACRRDFTYAAGDWKPRLCVTDLRDDGSTLHPFQCKAYAVSVTP